MTGPQIGQDGTVLAEVRDLRRYLLLVEAEMVARGAVPEPADPALADLIPGVTGSILEDSNRHAAQPEPEPARPTFVQLKAEELERIHEGSARAPRQAGEGSTSAPAPEPVQEPERPVPIPVGAPEDQDGIVDVEVVRRSQLPHRTVWVGQSQAEAEKEGKLWHVVDRNLVEDEVALLHLPRLPRELNSKELEEARPYYRHMYRWVDDRQTWQLKPIYARWGGTGH